MFNPLKTLRNSRTRNKVLAITSAGLVVGVGAAMTLATWTDTEWDFAGANGIPGLGTSTFVVQQNVTNPYVSTVAAPGFNQNQTNPGDSLDFETGALVLSPGDTVTAPVALETTAASIGGTLQLNAAVPATATPTTDPSNALWNALVVHVGWVSVAPGGAVPDCTASLTGFTPVAMTSPRPGNAGLDATPAVGTQVLQGATGNVLHYCFTITLPAGSPSTLQGLSDAPAWHFSAVSS